ncbi:MAG: hypothetical protein HQK52_04385 [Oligoflexia bacterium]|nr:hypothetical protein [Oligoflexia bacterium]
MNYDIGYFDEIDYKFAPNESAFGDQLKTLTLKREENKIDNANGGLRPPNPPGFFE